MKYIRTEDGIKNVPDYYAKKLIETSTLKIADTIEELCDEFVCLSKNGKHTVSPSFTIIDLLGTVIYGAIWTEWGLKYVAKMNEEGELELL